MILGGIDRTSRVGGVDLNDQGVMLGVQSDCGDVG